MSLEMGTSYLNLLECLSLKVEKGKVLGLFLVFASQMALSRYYS